MRERQTYSFAAFSLNKLEHVGLLSLNDTGVSDFHRALVPWSTSAIETFKRGWIDDRHFSLIASIGYRFIFSKQLVYLILEVQIWKHV